MNLNKSLDFFDPSKVDTSVHIIGCGAIGSTLADLLVRLGVTNIHLYDFDTVTAHNIANQRYDTKDIGLLKVIALSHKLNNINPDVKTVCHADGWIPNKRLRGHVFLCVDSVNLRKEIVKYNALNEYILTIHDFRMRLQDAQYYFCLWKDPKAVENFRIRMDFTDEEAKESTPVSACGTSLSVMSTVNTVCSLGIANFMKHIKGENPHNVILVDAFVPDVLVM